MAFAQDDQHRGVFVERNGATGSRLNTRLELAGKALSGRQVKSRFGDERPKQVLRQKQLRAGNVAHLLKPIARPVTAILTGLMESGEQSVPRLVTDSEALTLPAVATPDEYLEAVAPRLQHSGEGLLGLLD